MPRLEIISDGNIMRLVLAHKILKNELECLMTADLMPAEKPFTTYCRKINEPYGYTEVLKFPTVFEAVDNFRDKRL